MFYFGGTDIYIDIPENSTHWVVKAWAGGGGGARSDGGYKAFKGGTGGHTRCVITATDTETLRITVGGGGTRASMAYGTSAAVGGGGRPRYNSARGGGGGGGGTSIRRLPLKR